MNTNQSTPDLNGAWVPVKQELNGRNLPVSENSKLTIDNGKYAFETYGAVDKGDSTYDDGKIDIYSREGVNAGKHFKAIYKLEDDLYTVCYNLAGDSYPTKFDSTLGPMFFLCVFKRQ
jgi:uncharacterized protein (TIGR03067 family)